MKVQNNISRILILLVLAQCDSDLCVWNIANGPILLVKPRWAFRSYLTTITNVCLCQTNKQTMQLKPIRAFEGKKTTRSYSLFRYALPNQVQHRSSQAHKTTERKDVCSQVYTHTHTHTHTHTQL